jgi:hypothetical protein
MQQRGVRQVSRTDFGAALKVRIGYEHCSGLISPGHLDEVENASIESFHRPNAGHSTTSSYKLCEDDQDQGLTTQVCRDLSDGETSCPALDQR